MRNLSSSSCGSCHCGAFSALNKANSLSEKGSWPWFGPSGYHVPSLKTITPLRETAALRGYFHKRFPAIASNLGQRQGRQGSLDQKHLPQACHAAARDFILTRAVTTLFVTFVEAGPGGFSSSCSVPESSLSTSETPTNLLRVWTMPGLSPLLMRRWCSKITRTKSLTICHPLFEWHRGGS